MCSKKTLRLGHVLKENVEGDRKEHVRECVDWMHLACDRGQWRVVMRKIMSIRVPRSARKFLILRY